MVQTIPIRVRRRRWANGSFALQWTAMRADIRDRLRRLGVHKGAGHLKVSVPRGRDIAPDIPAKSEPARAPVTPLAPDRDTPLWNLELESTMGRAFVRRTRYALDYQHGGYA